MTFQQIMNDSSSSEYALEVVDQKRLAVVEQKASGVHAPIVSSVKHRIRPLLDCVDKLRHLNIMQDGIQLPTIVVVGDQSSDQRLTYTIPRVVTGTRDRCRYCIYVFVFRKY